MTETIIVAVLALVGTLTGSYFSNRKAQALQEYRIKDIEIQLEGIPNLNNRIFELEKRMSLAEAEEVRLNTRLKNIEAQ